MRHSHPVLATRLMLERKQLRHNVRDVLPGLHPIAVRAAELPRDHGDPFDRAPDHRPRSCSRAPAADRDVEPVGEGALELPGCLVTALAARAAGYVEPH